MEKCRTCLQYRKNVRSINDKTDGVSFADMIMSIANIKIRNDDGITDKLCYACRKKLTEAYNFKLCIERSNAALQETLNLKIINFKDLNDIKIKIEIDCKPVVPSTKIFPDKLFKDGSSCISYNNTVIKRVENVKKMKALSVVDFLNSIKTESDLDCDYQEYDVSVEHYHSDSGSNYSYENKQPKKKAKKHKTKSKHDTYYNPTTRKWGKFPKFNPIKPKFIGDLRLVPAKPLEIKRTPRPPKPKMSKPMTICPYCGKLTKKLNSHLLLHTAEKTYKCDQCPKAYFKLATLTLHKKMHTQEKDFKCSHCIAAFNCTSALNRHMIMHREERNFVCTICSKTFKRKCSISRHMMIHNFGIKPVKCELCPMTFSSKGNLRHHMRVHTGERPFRCDICSQPYSYKHDFNRHCLKKHGIFLKRRHVYVMNEEVLQRERTVMRDLALRAHGIIKEPEVQNPFDGPQAALAFEMAMKAIEENKVPIIY